MPVVRLPAVVLAAGLSSRMGDFKPLMELGGRSLLMRVVDSLRGSGRIGEIVVVVGHRAVEVQAALVGEAGVRIVLNEHFAAGEMLSSVKAGVGALGEDVAGFVLAFADQPAVLPETVAALVNRWEETGAALVLPTYGGKRGHPIVMGARLIPEILALEGSATLKRVVHDHLPEAALVEVSDPSVLEDLDTPEDFSRAAALFGKALEK